MAKENYLFNHDVYSKTLENEIHMKNINDNHPTINITRQVGGGFGNYHKFRRFNFIPVRDHSSKRIEIHSQSGGQKNEFRIHKKNTKKTRHQRGEGFCQKTSEVKYLPIVAAKRKKETHSSSPSPVKKKKRKSEIRSKIDIFSQ